MMNDKSKEELSEREIFTWMAEDFFIEDVFYGEHLEACQHEACHIPKQLLCIEKFVEKVIASDDFAFIQKNEGKRPSDWERLSLANDFFLINGDSYRLPDYQYSEYVTVFFNSCLSLGLYLQKLQGIGPADSCFVFDPPFKPSCESQQQARYESEPISIRKRAGEAFNDLIKLIRVEAATPEVRNKNKHRKYQFKRKSESFKKYIENLFVVYPTVYVVRMDFGYQRSPDKPVSFEQITIDLNKFLNNRRCNNLFNDLIGYVWRFDYTYKERHHLHFILFFRSTDGVRDESLADRIGRYWIESITGGLGKYFDCKRSKRRYKQLCTGIIHRDDDERRKELSNFIQYLSTKDQYLRVQMPLGTHMLGKGHAPPEMTKKRGKPSKSRSTIAQRPVLPW